MKYKNIITNIAIAVLCFKLLRNLLCYVLVSNQVLPEGNTIPYNVNFIEFLYPTVTFAVTMILARFLIERPTIYARNLFIFIQAIVIFYIGCFIRLEWVASLDAPALVQQVNGFFMAIQFINIMLSFRLIYLAYLIERDSRLASNTETGNLNG